MTGFEFHSIQFDWPEKITNGSYLWIWNADKIPPHIAISRGQNYFSLTYKECEIQKSVLAMVRKVKRSEIPLVLVDLSNWLFTRDFSTVYSNYPFAQKDGPTCLSPIKELLELEVGVHQLSDLLTEIEKRGELKNVFAVNLTTDFNGIPQYSVAEIMSRIELLHETERSKSKSSSC